jgi:hypothetical protein
MRLAPLPAAPWQKATYREDREAAGRPGVGRATMAAVPGQALQGKGPAGQRGRTARVSVRSRDSSEAKPQHRET